MSTCVWPIIFSPHQQNRKAYTGHRRVPPPTTKAPCQKSHVPLGTTRVPRRRTRNEVEQPRTAAYQRAILLMYIVCLRIIGEILELCGRKKIHTSTDPIEPFVISCKNICEEDRKSVV